MFKVSLFVGTGTDKNGNVLFKHPIQAALSAVSATLSSRYGGVTIYKHRGAWFDAGNRLVSERGYTLVTFVDAADREAALADVKPVAEFLRDRLNQECVLVSVEGSQIEFV